MESAQSAAVHLGNSTDARVPAPVDLSGPPWEEEFFWRFVAERQRIWWRKEQLLREPPWTLDAILQRQHFCNVFRSLDRGTRWYVDNIANKADNLTVLLWKTILYRIINNWRQFEAVGGVPYMADWPKTIQAIRRAGIVLNSPAYLILGGGHAHEDRTSHFARILPQIEAQFNSGLVQDIWAANSLEKVSRRLQRVPGVGPFVAMQIYRDLMLAGDMRFSEDDWVEIGPGADWSLQYIFRAYTPKAQHDKIAELAAKSPQIFVEMDEFMPMPTDIHHISQCDIQHSLCEAGKYIRQARGIGKKRRYPSV